jgi:hypothetical protein
MVRSQESSAGENHKCQCSNAKKKYRSRIVVENHKRKAPNAKQSSKDGIGAF